MCREVFADGWIARLDGSVYELIDSFGYLLRRFTERWANRLRASPDSGADLVLRTWAGQKRRGNNAGSYSPTMLKDLPKES
jgi:hypothetical protein